MKQEQATMKGKEVDFRLDQLAFMKAYKKKTGVPANHFVRLAVDKEIDRIQGEEKKIANFQKEQK